MDYVWATILVALNGVWLAAVVFGLPGTWLMVASTALLAWWRWEAHPPEARMFSLWTLGAIVAIAAAGEVLELLAGLWGAAQAGGTRWGSLGALLGGIAGALLGTFLIPVPIVGSLVGACAGAAIGACGLELLTGRRMDQSIRSGAGAGVGTLFGRLGKLGAGVVIWVVIAVAAFWP